MDMRMQIVAVLLSGRVLKLYAVKRHPHLPTTKSPPPFQQPQHQLLIKALRTLRQRDFVILVLHPLVTSTPQEAAVRLCSIHTEQILNQSTAEVKAAVLSPASLLGVK
ncbi:hypothetical protein OESDEN_16601 [Oesophagostomum dentatum]|uniref:Uncharacterized protein n=1 Tax=Oesophagostomum dentatum TaxID=61180 RepID=A0A0B1SEI2_OESDE|nr:hypothetical protein OESDEN_16601 [Oesophagostomum dentatum]